MTTSSIVWALTHKELEQESTLNVGPVVMQIGVHAVSVPEA